VELKPASVELFEYRLTCVEGSVARFSIECSSGTYIRSLAHDMGQKLGCGAHLAEIIRTAMIEPLWDDGIEILSTTTNWIRLSVRCDILAANRLVQFYREASPLPDVETEEVATAFREILLNAMEHGGNFDPTQYVEIGYVRTRRLILCKIKDPGTGFSLDELKHSALNNPPDDPFRHMKVREERGMRAGGFGILMSKRLVDDLIYNEQGNEVLLIKYLDKADQNENQ